MQESNKFFWNYNITMITKLILKNWRSHESSEFEFSKGTNVLVGPMGSGKSTAMDAVSFALFGTFPNLQSRKVKLDDIIMNKPAVKNQASVEVHFKANGQIYNILRTIERGKGATTSKLKLGDKLIEGPQTKRVTERVCDILKVNYDLFSRAVYAEQNNIDYFLEIPKGARKQKIDELLMIDKFENARKNLTTVINRLKDRVEEKKRFVSEIKEIDDIPGLEAEIREKVESIEKRKLELSELGIKKNKLEEGYRRISFKREKFEKISGLIKENHGKVSILKEKIESFGEVGKNKDLVETELERLNEERERISKKTEERNKIEKEVERYRALIDQDTKNIEEYNKKLDELKIRPDIGEVEDSIKKNLEIKLKELEEKTGLLKSLEIHLSHLDESVEKLNLGTEKCPVCDSELSDVKRSELLEKKGLEKEKIRKEVNELNVTVSNMKKEKQELEKKLEELKNELKKLDEKKWILDAREESRKRLDENGGIMGDLSGNLRKIEIKRTLEEVDKQIKEAEKALEIFSSRQELEKSMKRLKELEEELKKLDYDKELEKSVYERLKECEKNLALLSQEAKNIREIISEKQKRLEELNKIRKELIETKEEVSYLSNTTDSFEILQNVLQGVQTALRQEFVETTNSALSDVWQRMYPYGDYIDLKLGIDETGDYILQLKTRGSEWVNVEGVTSGGERSIACLALRIALSLVLARNLSWLVLDEPTHNLDRRAIQELSKTLKEHLPEIVEQIFIITHEPELEKAASGHFYRLERNKEEDEPTRIVQEEIGV